MQVFFAVIRRRGPGALRGGAGFRVAGLNSSWEFPKIGVPHLGVLTIRILLFRYYIRVPYFRKLQVAAKSWKPEDWLLQHLL